MQKLFVPFSESLTAGVRKYCQIFEEIQSSELKDYSNLVQLFPCTHNFLSTNSTKWPNTRSVKHVGIKELISAAL